MDADVVICYSSKDREQVMTLVERLRSAGVSVWIDYGGIDGALLWGQEIVEAIEACKVLVFMASTSSVASPNVVREISLASESNKPILPLHLEPIEIPKSMKWQLAGIQHLELFRGDDENNFRGIARSLTRLGISLDGTASDGSRWQSSSVIAHGDKVNTVAFSSDGQLLATGSADNTVRLHEVSSGELQETLTLDDAVAKLAFSNHGARLASLEKESKSVHLWAVPTWEKLSTITTNFAMISIAFSPDGEILASSGDDYKVKFWDVESGILELELDHEFRAVSLAFSPDGKTLACGCYKEVRLWDVATAKLINTFAHEAHVTSVTFSPDGKLLAVGSWDYFVMLINVQTGQLQSRLKSDSKILPLSFSPDSKTLVGGGWDGSVEVWDLSRGETRNSLKEHTQLVTAVTFSPAGGLFATASWDGTARLWR